MSLREGWGDLDFWQICIPSGAGRVVQPPGSVHRVTEFSQGLATEWHGYPRGELKIRRPIVRAEVDRLRDPELPDRLADTETAAQDATDDAWQEAVGDLVAELVDLQERMDALVGRYRRLGGLLNHHLQADVAEAVDAHQGTARLLNANVAAESARCSPATASRPTPSTSRLSEVDDGLDVRYRPRAQPALRAAPTRAKRTFLRRGSPRCGGRGLRRGTARAARAGARRPGDRWLFADERRWLDQLDTYWRWRTEPTNGDKADQ